MTEKKWQYDPADDLALPPGEALRSVVREPGLVGCACARVWWLGVRQYLRWRQGLTIEGRERLPGAGPYVIVANHASHFDALVLGAAAPWRLRHLTFPIAAGDTFFDTPTHTAFASMALNALPMWRKNAGRHALAALRKRVTTREGVFVLFPEGTRSRDGAMGRFKEGIGMLVAGTDTPVLPAHIAGAYEAWPPGAGKPGRGRITVRIGAPRTFADVENRRHGWKQIAEELERDVRALGGV